MTTDRALELAEAALHEKRLLVGGVEYDEALREIESLRLFVQTRRSYDDLIGITR